MRPLATAKAKRKQGAAGRGGGACEWALFPPRSYAGLRGRRSYRSSAPLVSEARTNPDEACSAKGIKSVGEIFVFVWKTLRPGQDWATSSNIGAGADCIGTAWTCWERFPGYHRTALSPLSSTEG
ncbi:unnamed protein product [Arctogadus glacialis]